jgi:DNA-binding SARP family transcriptional activator
MDVVARTRFTLLGPVRMWRDETEVEIRQPQLQALLASLLLREGDQVSAGTLIDDLWGSEPPSSASALIRTYVYKLRQLLGREGIASVGGGYALNRRTAAVDVYAFEQLLVRAREERGAGEPARAVKHYAEALALWNGTALFGLPGPYAQVQRVRLNELRLGAIEECLGCRLRLGLEAEVAAYLVPLIADNPLRERLRELHMLALCGMGRQTDALEIYRETTKLLRDDLGLDPGPALRDTHRRILTGDVESGGAPTESATARVPRAITPAQLPAALPRFTGRQDALRELIDAASAPGPGRPTVHLVHGMAGVGKSVFAVHAARLLAPQYPDGQIHVNLRGFDTEGSALDPLRVLGDFLPALGVRPDAIPAGLAARSALFNSVVAGRRILFVLDNARDAQQIRPLLPGAPTCRTIVTSRQRLTGLYATHQAHALDLPPFTADEAASYLAGVLGPDRLRAEPELAERIVERCAGLPLALAILAARAAHRSHPLGWLPTTGSTSGTLDPLVLGSDPAVNVRQVFSLSYASLPAERARFFRLLALHPGPQFTVHSAAATAGLTPQVACEMLTELADIHMMLEAQPGRFAFHDLVRAYALELSAREDDAEEREQAELRLLDHYVYSTRAADTRYMPGKRGIADLPEPLAGAQPREFASTQDALRWFDDENAALRFLLSWSAERHIDLHTWRLGWSLLIYQQWRSRTVEAWDTMQLSMQAAQRLGDPQITANVQVGLAFVESALDRSAESHRSLCKARDLELASGEDPPAVLARFHSRAGSMLESRQEYLAALPEHRAGLRLAVKTGNEAMLRLQLIRIAAAHAKLGHYRQAVSCGEAALRRMEKQRTESSGGIVGLGRVLDILGYAYHRIGLHSEADAYSSRAISELRARESTAWLAEALDHRGETLLASGDRKAAAAAWAESLARYKELDSPAAWSLRIRLAALRS